MLIVWEMFVYQVCVALLFFTRKIHVESNLNTAKAQEPIKVISLVSGQTSTLYIWLCDSLVLQSGKTPGVMLIVWMLSCHFGSFFRLLCDWLESVQWCWGSIWCSFFLLKLDTPLAIARQLCGCLLQYLYQVDPPQTFRTSFHSSRHLTRCGDVSKKVRVQAWFTNVPTITQEEK